MDHPALPFGISSQFRNLPDIDGQSFVVARSAGARLIDTAGRSFVDYGMAMGANLVGHAHPAVQAACVEALANGSMPGFRHPGEAAAAAALARIGGRRVTRATFVTTGTEAVHLACRIARATTGRRLVAKAAGGYDGWLEDVRFGLAGSPEADRASVRPVRGEMTLLRANELDDLDRLFDEHGPDLAAVLIEPMLANSGCLVPDRAYFERLTQLARANGTMIVSDEVLVGLRRGGRLVCHEFGLDADLVTMGKAIGSGLPVAAVLGTPEAFAVIESGAILCYGTYHGNPLVTGAVSATLSLLDDAAHAAIDSYGAAMRAMIREAFAEEGIAVTTTGFDSVFSLWFCDSAPRTYAEAKARIRPEASFIVHKTLRRNGVIALASPFGRYFISAAHAQDERLITERAFKAAAQAVARYTGSPS